MTALKLKTGQRLAVDEDCPACRWPERWFDPATETFGCPKCDATSPLRDRIEYDSMRVHNREVRVGQELTIEGIRGRCEFSGFVKTSAGREWVDIMTPRGRRRTVRPSAIKTVHRWRPR